jgi:hypothetical protein
MAVVDLYTPYNTCNIEKKSCIQLSHMELHPHFIILATYDDYYTMCSAYFGAGSMRNCILVGGGPCVDSKKKTIAFVLCCVACI